MTPPPPPLRPDLRDQWLLADDLTFLNHGSFGAIPRAVFDAQTDWRLRLEADPIEIIGRRCADLIERAKQPVAQKFGMPPVQFGFVTNATEGVNAVLRSIEFKPGDELLTTDHVYGAVRQAMKLTARRAGASYVEVAVPLPVMSGDEVVDRVTSAITSRTRLVVIDHVTSPTGLVFPVETIAAHCKSHGIDVLVDGAHTPGMLPLDVGRLSPTYYAANLHKWALAPKGTAFLWVDPAREVHPLVVSHYLGEGFSREFSWQGTRDLSAWLTAPAGIAFLDDLGWDAALDHNHRLAVWAHQYLVDRWGVGPISPLDGSLLGSLAAVPMPGRFATLDDAGLVDLQQHLHDHHRIEVPMIRWPGGNMLRVSCQLYNTPTEYERLGDVIARMR